MALLWVEGFEGFGTTTSNDPLPLGAVARKYISVANETNMVMRQGRVGGYCLEMPNAATFSTPVLTTDDTLIVGCAFRNQGGTDYTIVAFFDGADKNINVRWEDGTGEISIWRENTLLDTSVALGLNDDTWYYLEMKVKTNDSTGTYDVDVAEVNIFSASGVDTKFGSNNYSDRVRFFGATSNPRWDDIYVLDATGSVNNDILGNPKVVSIDPGGDDTANWGTSTPSVNHYENVDENPSDDDTSYVEENTANTTDLYDYEAIPGVGTIYGIQINTMCRETDASTFSLITPIESNGSQYDDSPQVIGSTNYLTKVRVAETDPDTGALWTESGLNAAKIGVKVG
jgi:hypothetical protein